MELCFLFLFLCPTNVAFSFYYRLLFRQLIKQTFRLWFACSAITFDEQYDEWKKNNEKKKEKVLPQFSTCAP